MTVAVLVHAQGEGRGKLTRRSELPDVGIEFRIRLEHPNVGRREQEVENRSLIYLSGEEVHVPRRRHQVRPRRLTVLRQNGFCLNILDIPPNAEYDRYDPIDLGGQGIVAILRLCGALLVVKEKSIKMDDPNRQGVDEGERKPPKLLDRVAARLRTLHYSIRTEEAYVGWIRRYILHHGKRHPNEMGGPEVEAFLTHLAVKENVAASTQNQALAALLFLYQQVLERDLPPLQTIRAKRPKRLPDVLSIEEVRAVLGGMDGVYRIMAELMYGSGLRLLECCRLRVKDIDFARKQIIVREGKGDKDRAVPLPARLVEPLQKQIRLVAGQHERDLERGHGRVRLPGAFDRKSVMPSARLPGSSCSLQVA